jgi:hypothetical protein
MERDYQPFIIRVDEQIGDDFPVRADFLGATWTATIPRALPLLSIQEIEQAKLWLERGFIDRDYTKDFGGRLFRTLFQDVILGGFRVAYERVAKKDNGLRIVLILPQDLVALPWELMYDGDGGHGFLARSTTAPLVRHYNVTIPPHDAPEKGPLRILLVTASPRDLPAISSNEEAEKIRESLSGKRVGIVDTLKLLVRHLRHTRSISDFFQRLHYRNLFEIETLPHATKSSFQNKIREAQGNNIGYHVVHFIGHGKTDRNGSSLVFESKDNKAESVTAEEFAEILSEPTINLAVLNACETASTSSLFQSVAQATLQRGVPTVIGMQVPILDRTAVGFAQEFYGAWASGQAIESALSYARRLIKEESPGDAAEWGIPLCITGSFRGLKLDLLPPPLYVPPVVRLLKWSITVFLSLLGTIGLLLTIPDVNHRLRTEVPVIRCVFPYPMDPGFNIVVNQFTVVDQNGSTVISQDGLAMAKYLYEQLNYNIGDLDPRESYNIRPPEQTCLIKGKTREDREVNAGKLADDLKADIIVYGVIQAGDGLGSFSPEFYVNYKSFQEAGEITGQHQFGESVSIVLPFDISEINPTTNPELYARTQALSLLTIGLSYYSIDNFEQASNYFSQAKNTPGWLNLPGKEIVYLLLGNTGNRRYSVEKSAEYEVRAAYLEEALNNYNEALRLNENYPRATSGKAGTLYLQALGNPAEGNITKLDLAKLDEATRLYNDALRVTTAPDNANMKAKVHFGLGKIYLALYLRALATNEDVNTPRSRADAEFRAVLKEYDDGNGNVRIANLAGHSYAFLGLMAQVQEKYGEAIDLTTQAINIVSPYYQSYYRISLGDIYVDSCDIDSAAKAYQDALGLAKTYGFEDLVEKATSKLEALKNVQCQP